MMMTVAVIILFGCDRDGDGEGWGTDRIKSIGSVVQVRVVERVRGNSSKHFRRPYRSPCLISL